MHVEIHDKDGRVEVEDLTLEGLAEARHQAERLIEEIDDNIYREQKADELAEIQG